MKCSHCVFHDVYRDMGASMDVCLLHSDLDKAVKACSNNDPCLFKLSFKEAKKIVFKRGSKDEH